SGSLNSFNGSGVSTLTTSPFFSSSVYPTLSSLFSSQSHIQSQITMNGHWSDSDIGGWSGYGLQMTLSQNAPRNEFEKSVSKHVTLMRGERARIQRIFAQRILIPDPRLFQLYNNAVTECVLSASASQSHLAVDGYGALHSFVNLPHPDDIMKQLIEE
ncbi:MAG: hypothetical protein EZS28_056648, partial [Streblomastix strix]